MAKFPPWYNPALATKQPDDGKLPVNALSWKNGKNIRYRRRHSSLYGKCHAPSFGHWAAFGRYIQNGNLVIFGRIIFTSFQGKDWKQNRYPSFSTFECYQLGPTPGDVVARCRDYAVRPILSAFFSVQPHKQNVGAQVKSNTLTMNFSKAKRICED